MSQSLLWLSILLLVKVSLVLRFAHLEFHLRDLLFQNLKVLHKLQSKGFISHLWRSLQFVWWLLSSLLSGWLLLCRNWWLILSLSILSLLWSARYTDSYGCGSLHRILIWFQILCVWSLTAELTWSHFARYFRLISTHVDGIVTVPTTTPLSDWLISTHYSRYMLLSARSRLVRTVTATSKRGVLARKGHCYLLTDLVIAGCNLLAQWVCNKLSKLVWCIVLLWACLLLVRVLRLCWLCLLFLKTS